jgi:hypothetical protein
MRMKKLLSFLTYYYYKRRFCGLFATLFFHIKAEQSFLIFLIYWILKVPSFSSDLLCAASPKYESFTCTLHLSCLVALTFDQ